MKTAVKGCVSQGKTKAEALKNIREAMEAYVEAIIEDVLAVVDVIPAQAGIHIGNLDSGPSPE